MSFHFLTLKSGECSLCGKPPMEVWSCELGGRLPPPNGTGFTEPCIYLVRGTRLFIEDACVILMISWPRAMPDLTRG